MDLFQVAAQGNDLPPEPHFSSIVNRAAHEGKIGPKPYMGPYKGLYIEPHKALWGPIKSEHVGKSENVRTNLKILKNIEMLWTT